mmetsp:Transcript_55916/g.109450  ORF Transcript_55916/g.109450 Transcript_55916/m.109450 type:complete len:149 (-) Transcript_55916:152-598(-)
MERGQLGFLRKLEVAGVWGPLHGQVFQVFKESKLTFLKTLSLPNLSLLSELSLLHFHLNDADMLLLAEAVRVGNLCGIRVLNLDGNQSVGGKGMEALMRAVVESQKGLPLLKRLCIPYDVYRFTGSTEAIIEARVSGKLPRTTLIQLF